MQWKRRLPNYSPAARERTMDVISSVAFSTARSRICSSISVSFSLSLKSPLIVESITSAPASLSSSTTAPFMST